MEKVRQVGLAASNMEGTMSWSGKSRRERMAGGEALQTNVDVSKSFGDEGRKWVVMREIT